MFPPLPDRTDLMPPPATLARVTATQIRAYRRLVALADDPGKPRAFRCVQATAAALVAAGLAVERDGLYRSALVSEVECEVAVWFELFHDRAYEPTGLVTVARPGRPPHYLRVRVRCGGATAEVLPVKGFPMVNSVPMEAARVRSEEWRVIDASEEDLATIRSAGFGSMAPEPEPAPALEPGPAPAAGMPPKAGDWVLLRVDRVRVGAAIWIVTPSFGKSLDVARALRFADETDATAAAWDLTWTVVTVGTSGRTSWVEAREPTTRFVPYRLAAADLPRPRAAPTHRQAELPFAEIPPPVRTAMLSETDRKVLALWDRPQDQLAVLSSAQIGEALYGQVGRMPQHYARPGGKAARKLVAAGFLLRASVEGRPDGFARRVAAAELLGQVAAFHERHKPPSNHDGD